MVHQTRTSRTGFFLVSAIRALAACSLELVERPDRGLKSQREGTKNRLPRRVLH